MNYAEYIFEKLKSIGVKHVFMLSGGGCMYLVDALGRSGIAFTCCLHEQAVAIAALAYAQYSGELGVALVTSGPGATNALTGVVAAWDESVPLLVLSGQVKRPDIGWVDGLRSKGVQEAPISEMAKPVTKYSVTVHNPALSRYHLEKAIHLAASGRKGPVWLDVPLDVQSGGLDFEHLPGYCETHAADTAISIEKLQYLRHLLAESERPVILAGYGVRLSNAVDAFADFCATSGIPVLTTWKAADILPDDSPVFIGRPGTAGQRAANYVMQNADLLICVGARLDAPQIGYEQSLFAREAKKVIVDIDPAELSKWKFHTDLPICAEAGVFIRELAELPRKGWADWLDCCKKWKLKYGLVPQKHYEKEDYASLYVLVEALSRHMTSEDVIVPGSSGMGSDVSYQAARIKNGQRMLNSPGIGSMGFGIPSALGACVASGRKRVICVNGDGGFQMNIQELETVASLNLPVKFFVINNQGYGSIRNTQRNYFSGRYVGSSDDSGVRLPEITAIGKAYGFDTFTIKTNAGIEKTVPLVLASEGPAICEVRIHPNDTLEFRASSVLRPDGTSMTAPMEDLSPRLPRKEHYGNMFVKPVNALGVNLCNIVFDFDGTLADSGEGIAASASYALEKCGYAQLPREAITGTIGLPLTRMMEKLLPDKTPEQYEALCRSYREHYAEKGLYQCRLYDGISKWLPELAEEFDLYIVTSKPSEFVNKLLQKFGIGVWFKSVYGAELGFSPKKKSRIFSELMAETGMDRAKTIMVGDRDEDISAAAENGVKTIAVSYGYGKRDEFTAAFKIVDSVEALQEILY